MQNEVFMQDIVEGRTDLMYILLKSCILRQSLLYTPQ